MLITFFHDLVICFYVTKYDISSASSDNSKKLFTSYKKFASYIVCKWQIAEDIDDDEWGSLISATHSVLIGLCIYFFILVMVIDMVMAWSLRDCDSIWLYDISLTHIRP